jgi:hypothetical protein
MRRRTAAFSTIALAALGGAVAGALVAARSGRRVVAGSARVIADLNTPGHETVIFEGTAEQAAEIAAKASPAFGRTRLVHDAPAIDPRLARAVRTATGLLERAGTAAIIGTERLLRGARLAERAVSGRRPEAVYSPELRTPIEAAHRAPAKRRPSPAVKQTSAPAAAKKSAPKKSAVKKRVTKKRVTRTATATRPAATRPR